ncbi:MAG: OmpA family protein [Ignavibacteria bacterium]|nr:OmpA family protein [Ignavibacteria bacterium]
MPRLVYVIAFLIVAVVAMKSQTDNSKESSLRVGLFGNVDYSLYSASFSQLPGIPNCCPEFKSGSGVGWLVGLSYLAPISEDLNLHLRMHYGAHNGMFSVTETKEIVDGSDNRVNATITHELTGTFNQVSLEPLLGYKVTSEFSILGGVTVGYLLSSKFEQQETLSSPDNAVFSTGSKVRNYDNTDIPGAQSIALGLTVGANYDIALNSSKTVFLSPEVLFSFSPLSVAKDVSWTIQHLRGGLQLSFIPPAIEDTLSDYELYEVVRAIKPPTKGTPGVQFVSDVTVSGLSSDGRQVAVSSVKVEEFESNRIRPILPYVFFDEMSATIPQRYPSVNETQRENYSMDNFYNLDAMVTYYQLLNIVGRRMEDNPAATITLTGCGDKSESGVADMGTRRASAVKNYLTSNWGISDSRITTMGRELPEQASNSADADGREENRRVEISSNSSVILAPVSSKDTLRSVEPAGLRFSPTIDPRVPIHSWTLWVTSGDRIIKAFHDGDPVPASVDWRIADQGGNHIKNTTQLKYLVAVRDSASQLIPSATKTIPVTEITLASKLKSGGPDKTVDRYSMILFPFDKSDLTVDNMEITQNIKNNIQPGARVSIIGYTDRSGGEEYNQKLSEQRAKSVARSLSQSESAATGVGERLPLYDNNSPEGRFYSRTVEVFVETDRK